MSTSKSRVVLELTEEEELQLFRLAHEKDISLNQFVEELLEAEIEKYIGRSQLELF